MDVRVALRVDVAFRAIHASRHFERRDVAAGLEEARPAGRHAAVAGLLDQHRQPAGLELHAGAHHEVCIARARDQARPRLDVVGILQSRGGAAHLDAVAAQARGEIGPLGLARQHVERGMAERRAQKQQHEGASNESVESVHGAASSVAVRRHGRRGS